MNIQIVKDPSIQNFEQTHICFISRDIPTFQKLFPDYFHEKPIEIFGFKSHTIYGLIEGLKIFEEEGIDQSKFHEINVKKRKASKKRGKLIGYFNNNNKKEIISLAYRFLCKNQLVNEMILLQGLLKEGNKIEFIDSSIEHAHHIKNYLLLNIFQI